MVKKRHIYAYSLSWYHDENEHWLYYFKIGQFFPFLACCEVVIKLLEGAVFNNKIVTHEDLVRALNIYEDEYDIKI